MFRHTDHLQFDAKPEKPDPVYAHKLQELIGGAWGEMSVTMQYLFQGWNCRMPGKYKDLIMDIATEEIGHEEMLATMVARLLEGAPATATTKAAMADPVVGAVIGGMDPQQAIVSGGGALSRRQQRLSVERLVHHRQRQPARRFPRQRGRRGPGAAADRPAVQHDR
jgi:Mn-containing catalase